MKLKLKILRCFEDVVRVLDGMNGNKPAWEIYTSLCDKKSLLYSM